MEKEQVLIEEGRRLETLRAEKQDELDAEFAAREAALRERALRFARKQASKVKHIAELNSEEEAKRQTEAAVTAAEAAKKQARPHSSLPPLDAVSEAAAPCAGEA